MSKNIFFSKIWKKNHKFLKILNFFENFWKKNFFIYPKWIMLMLWLEYNQFFQDEKFDFFGQKLVHLLRNAQNGSICVRMHQNVCRMNCANVLYTKLSKQWFLSHFKGLKLTKYICHFVVENPVVVSVIHFRALRARAKRISPMIWSFL